MNFPSTLDANVVGAFKLGTPPPGRLDTPVLRRRIPSRGASSCDVLPVSPKSPSRSTVAPNGEAGRAAAWLPSVASDCALKIPYQHSRFG